jgi:hypothetical protein
MLKTLQVAMDESSTDAATDDELSTDPPAGGFEETDGGETALVNLVQLCQYHHRLVHEGGYGVKLSETSAFA